MVGKYSDVQFAAENARADTSPVGGNAALISACIVVIAFAAAAVYQQHPPAAASADAPEAEFSAGRAARHLLSIAQNPHPIGSAGHAAVRDYIVKELTAQGIRPEVQRTTVVNPTLSPPFRVATVNNVVGRMKGLRSEGGILLVAHYDSAPVSPGAGDDGAGVTTLLETLRALKAGQPLTNDVIFLFTDAEELGLLGARAFTAENPLAREIKVVLNFEARGSSGPSIMFETSDDNGWLIEEFGKAAPYPVANSLSQEIYKRLPNDTDLTAFRKAGFAGLNFAFIEGFNHYHTASDTIENASGRSLQHHGSYALSLARHFGNLSLADTRRKNSVYFNLPGTVLIRYPVSFVLPLTGALLVAFAFVLTLGLRRGMLTRRGLIIGFLALLVSGICAYATVAALWLVIRVTHRGLDSIPWQEPYNAWLYALSFILLAVGVTLSVYHWPLKKVGIYDLTAGAALWWLAATLPVAFFIPGGSYLLMWPLFFMLAGLGVSFSRREGKLSNSLLLLLLCALPGIVLLSPFIYQLFVALTLKSGPTVAIFVVLAMGLLVPQFKLMGGRKKALIMSAATLALSFGCAFAGLLTAGFDRRHPATDSLLYGLNADTGEAVWASPDGKTDEWTSRFLPAGSAKSKLPDFFPMSEQPFLSAPAPALPLPPPRVDLLSDETREGLRTLRLHITSPRAAPLVSVYVDKESRVMSATINDKSLQVESGGEQVSPWGMHYYAVPEEGVELVLNVESSRPVKIRIVDRTYGLPTLPDGQLQARPDHIIPTSSVYSEASFVSRPLSF